MKFLGTEATYDNGMRYDYNEYVYSAGEIIDKVMWIINDYLEDYVEDFKLLHILATENIAVWVKAYVELCGLNKETVKVIRAGEAAKYKRYSDSKEVLVVEYEANKNVFEFSEFVPSKKA